LIGEQIIESFNEKRHEMREISKRKIRKLQQENRRSYNLLRKPARKCKIQDIVAIKRTQFGSRLKLKAKFLGPCKVIKVKPNETYDVTKIGLGPSTKIMKAIHDAFEAKALQDGRNVGMSVIERESSSKDDAK